MLRYLTPKICATIAFVSGTVESHKKPIIAAKMYVVVGLKGSSKNPIIAIDRVK